MKFRRHATAILSLFLCLVWANHCVVSRALADAVPSHATHCQHHEEKGKGENKGCDENGCCQPGVFSASQSLSPVLASSELLIAPLTFWNSFTLLLSSLELVEGKIATTDPPGSLYDLLSCLSVAQNAPPFRS